MTILVLISSAGCVASDSESKLEIPTKSLVPTVALTATPSQPSLLAEPTREEISVLETYYGTKAGFTEEGHPYIGDLKAPVTLIEFSDYLCPFCGRYFNQTFPSLIEMYGKSGQVKFVFRDFPLVGLHPTAPVGHGAAICVAEQGAALFWEMHDQLFLTQNQWGALPDPTDFIASLAEEIGVDIAAYEECVVSERSNEIIDKGVLDGEALGFNGTPSFQLVSEITGDTYTLVGAQPVEIFVQYLDALIAGEIPTLEQAAEEEEETDLPFWASTDGLAPDPERPGFTFAGDQFKGNPDAGMVVVEFADFQCPGCRTHTLEVQPILDSHFVETGEILWVFKHLPLRLHPQAPTAAVAAECSADQGMFWEMENLLFQTVEEWSVTEPDPVFLELARSIGLDLGLFDECLNSRQALERVLNDLYDSQGVVNTTPSFIIIYGGQGGILRGSRQADEFVSILENMLESANSD
jgi:protein-disulfide isomerase